MKRVLDPQERISEILFGLIMVLTFTGSLSVAQAGSDDVRAMLIGALGCNLAWGFIDAIFYLMGTFAEKGRHMVFLRSVQAEADPAAARQLIADSMSPEVAALLGEADLDRLRTRLQALPAPPARPQLGADAWRGAAGVFFLVFFATFPVALPFVFLSEAALAMRVSNVVAVVMLFALGVAFGRFSGGRPLLTGLGMVALGVLLVGLTIALGG